MTENCYGWGDWTMAEFEETRFFSVKSEKENETREIILKVYQALKEKGHNPVSQIAGYLLSGDLRIFTTPMPVAGPKS